MTNTDIDNPQAFPSKDIKILYPQELRDNVEFLTSVNEIKIEHKGMTLRDYFAAKALIGLLSGRGHEPVEDFNHWTEQISEASYKYADSMLKERMKPHDQHEER